MVNKGLLKPVNRDMRLVDTTIEGLWEEVETYKAPDVAKWINKQTT